MRKHTKRSRYTAMLMVLSILLGMLSGLPISLSVSAASKEFAGGDGSSSSPYIIKTAEQLDNTRKYPSACFKLKNDIDLTGYLSEGGAGYAKWRTSGWERIGKSGDAFTGYFDGNGHKITGLWINRPGTNIIGLFGDLVDGKVLNLGLILNDGKGGIRGSGNTGGIAGYVKGNSKIQNCYVMGNVHGNSYTGGIAGQLLGGDISSCYAACSVTGVGAAGGSAGGLVGRQYGGNIENCYANGTVRGSYNVGGFLGAQDGGSIKNCYAVSSSIIGVSDSTGGFVGKQLGGSIQTSYYDNSLYGTGNLSGVKGLSTADMTKNAITNMAGFNFNNFWTVRKNTEACCGTTQYYPELKVFADADDEYTKAMSQLSAVSGLSVDENEMPFLQGSGAKGDPYKIYMSKQLNHMRRHLDKHFRLENNLGLTDFKPNDDPNGLERYGWQPVGTNSAPFTGSFNGGGYRITGLWISRGATDHVGLFGAIDGGSVKKLGLVLNGTSGSLVLKGITGGNNTGGLTGSLNGEIEECYVYGAVTGGEMTGGFTGTQTGGSIIGCWAAGNVTGGNSTGGFSGSQSGGDIKNSYSNGKVEGGMADGIGGFAGTQSGGSIIGCWAAGNVTGGQNTCGFAGTQDGQIQKCYFDKTRFTGDNGGVNGLTTEEMTSETEWKVKMPELANGIWKKRDNIKACCDFIAYYPELTSFMESDDAVMAQFSEKSACSREGSPDNEETFNKGSGVETDPWIIKTIYQFNHVRRHLNDHFKLAGNLSMDGFTANDDDYENHAKGWQPIGTNTTPFTGSLDGNGYRLTGFWINRGTTNYTGLFGRIDNGNIKNLGLELDSSKGGITGSRFTGGLAGSFTGTAENCYVSGNITGKDNTGGFAGLMNGPVSQCFSAGAVSGASNTGGFVGQQNSSVISTCYSTGNVNGGIQTGGFVGAQNSGSASACYSAGEVTGTSNTGGFAGLSNGSITDCYYNKTLFSGDANGAAALTTDEMTVEKTLENYMAGLGGENFWVKRSSTSGACCGTAKYYPELKIFAESADEGIESTSAVSALAEGIHLHKNEQAFLFGSGLESDPWVIGTPKQLNHMRSHMNKHFKLGADIDLFGFIANDDNKSNPSKGWQPVGASDNAFTGGLDGDGHTVTGLWISRDTANNGLFGYLSGAVIKNLNVDASSWGGVKGYNTTGILTGAIADSSLINNCAVSGNVDLAGWQHSNAGGLAGELISGTIEGSSSAASISGYANIGGLVGHNSGNIQNSTASGSVSGQDKTGGLVGNNNGSIQNSNANGSVSGIDKTGGLVGDSTSSIQNCSASGNVSGTNNNGGLVGTQNNGSIIDSYATGDVKGNYSGGLVGQQKKGRIEGCYAMGSVFGGWYSGGLVGSGTAGSIKGCYAAGSVSGTDMIGGLTGYIYFNAIENSYATGSVFGDENIGGLVGQVNGGNIQYCYASGNVEGRVMVSGFIGWKLDVSNITDCYATGNVKATGSDNIHFGGFLGFSGNGDVDNGLVSHCITANNVAHTKSSGGFVGYRPPKVNKNFSSCYFDMNKDTPRVGAGTSGDLWQVSNENGLVKRKTGEMSGNNAAKPGWMQDFDFNNVWIVSDHASFCCSTANHYPQLRVFAESSDEYTKNMSRQSTIAQVFGNSVHDNENTFTQGDGSESNPYKIYTAKQLNHVRSHSNSYYQLQNNIDLSGFNPNDDMNGSNGLGWQPIGTNGSNHVKGFDGANYKITGLWINRPDLDYVGLFGYLNDDAVIKNLSIEINDGNGGIKGRSYTGGLTGYQKNGGQIEDCSVTGSITGSDINTGGFTGYQGSSAEIQNSLFTGKVTGSRYTGGLTGVQYGLIHYSYAAGSVKGSGDYTGGLTGVQHGTITKSYATCGVTGQSSTGGLAGELSGGTLSHCYAAGNVNGQNSTGGLLGSHQNGSITSCYYDTQATGQAGAVNGGSYAGATGLTTAQMIKSDVLSGAMSGLGTEWSKRTAVEEYCYYPELTAFCNGTAVRKSVSEKSVRSAKQAVKISGASGLGITYGDALGDSVIKGTAKGARDGYDVAGTFTWADPELVPENSGADSFSVIFTPDSELYSRNTASASISISKRKITVTPDSYQEKIYGNSDPEAITYTYAPLLAIEDAMTGKLGRELGKSAGEYAYTMGSLSAGDGYELILDHANKFKINKADPNLTLSAENTNAMVTLTAAVKKADSGDLPTGKISFYYDGNKLDDATLSGGTCSLPVDCSSSSGDVHNFSIVYEGDQNYLDSFQEIEGYDISRKSQEPLIISGSSNVTYSDTLELGYTGGSGDGKVTWSVDNENIAVIDNDGNITTNGAGRVTVTLKKASDGTYNEARVQMILTVDRKPVTITGLGADNKTYDGKSAAQITGIPVIDGRISNDEVTGVSGTATFDSKDAGTGRTVTFSGFSLGGAKAGNYTLTEQPASVTAVIEPKMLIVTPQSNQWKYYGEKDPVISYNVNGNTDGEEPAFTDALVRAEGEDIGSYDINQGKLALDDNYPFSAGNYTLSLAAKTFEIREYNPPKTAVFSGTQGDNGWYIGDVSLDAPAGYAISASQDGSWENSITVNSEDGNGKTTAYYLKNNDTGAVSKELTSDIYRVDKTAPKGEIKIKANTYNSILDTIRFGLFFKETVDVSITGTDDSSGIASIGYIKTDKKMEPSELESASWSPYEGLIVQANEAFIIYAKITDDAGHVTILSSNGVVVYTDSTQDTKIIQYSKTSGKDVTAQVALNGNTVSGITNGGDALTVDEDYTVDDTNGTLTFKAAYLDNLEAKDYTLTVSYNPMGLAFAEGEDNEAPATTEISLQVSKAGQTIDGVSAMTKTYGDEPFQIQPAAPGNSSFTFDSSDEHVAVISADGTITIKGAGETDITVTAEVTGNYEQAQTSFKLTVEQAENIITNIPAVNKVYGDPPFTITPQANENPSFGFESSNASIIDVDADGTVTIKGSGSAVITVSADATANYKAATAAFSINAAQSDGQIISDIADYNVTYGDAKFTLSPTGMENPEFSFSSDKPAVAAVDPATGEVTIHGAGRAGITVTAAETDRYQEASVICVVTVDKAPQILDGLQDLLKINGEDMFTITPISNAAAENPHFSFQSSSTAVIDFDEDDNFIIKGTGAAIITVLADETVNYKAAVAAFNIEVLADTSSLKELIEKAQNLISELKPEDIGNREGQYPQKTVDALTDAIEKAREAADETHASQKTVDTAKDMLQKAINDFQSSVIRIDFTALDKAIAMADELDEANYTEASWDALQAALSEGKEIRKEADVAQPRVDEAAKTLNDAISGLIKVYQFTVEFETFTGTGNITGKINAPYEKFERLLINDKEVDSENYTVTEGSTVISLKEAYLKTLANGEYTVTAKLTDGYAETKLKISVKDGGSTSPDDDKSPDGGTSPGNNRASRDSSQTASSTGDSSNVWLWVLMTIISLGVIIIIGYRWRKITSDNFK